MNYLKKIVSLKQIQDYKEEWFLLLVGFLFILLRLPSLVEPSWYGDEGIYQVIGNALNNGSLLYRDIWDNKPPFLYLLYALFHSNLYYLKLASLLVGLISIYPFFLIGKKVLKMKKVTYFATLLYVILFGLPIIEGNIANAENFMLLPILVAVYLVLLYKEKKQIIYLLISGFLLSFAFITKIVAIFDFLTLLLFLTTIKYDELKESHLKFTFSYLKNYYHELFFGLIFSSLIVICGVYFYTRGAFLNFFQAVFLQNINYIQEQNRFIFPMGILTIKLILLAFFLGFIIKKRKSISQYLFLLYVWLALGVFSVFFSQRPYTHYVLVILPAFCLLVGFITLHKKKLYFGSFLALIIVLVTFFYFKIYPKTFEYYSNYVGFIFGNESVDSYQSFFDQYTPRDYELAHFLDLNTSPNESVFVWSDSAQIYALSNKLPPGKYAVAYHVTFYQNALSDTFDEIKKSAPRYIIQTKDSPEIKIFLKSFILKYKMNGAYIYERQV